MKWKTAQSLGEMGQEELQIEIYYYLYSYMKFVELNTWQTIAISSDKF